MGVLDGLEPKKVFKYFERIASIPHGSRNTRMISDCLAAFAEERGLRYIQDEAGNVIIFKDGTKGYENSPAVIIQGHMDMVCEKTPDSCINFERDGLELAKTDEYIYAKGTTLGGDDGIAVAFALAILDSEDIPHPPLEVVITVDEEIGMLGASALDCSKLKSKIMLNLDSEDEGQLLVSCAGGATVTLRYPAPVQPVKPSHDGLLKGIIDDDSYFRVKLSVTGVTGGHSGIEIHKQGANADMVLGRALNYLNKSEDVYINLVEVWGGLKDNAIPKEAYAVIDVYLDEDTPEQIEFVQRVVFDKVAALDKILKNEYKKTDPDIKLSVERIMVTDETPDDEMVNFSADYKNPTDEFVTILAAVPNGVKKMSQDIDGLVQTSLNLGIMSTEKIALNREIKMVFSVRSSVSSEKEELIDIIGALAKIFDGTIKVTGEYPAWEYKEDSKLREIMYDAYVDLFGEKPTIEAVHAGLECGIFAGKIKDLDCVSIGPRMEAIHTTDEKLYIESTKKYWNYVLEILKRLK